MEPEEKEIRNFNIYFPASSWGEGTVGNGSWVSLVAQGGGISENWVVCGVMHTRAWGNVIPGPLSGGDHKALSYLDIPE